MSCRSLPTDPTETLFSR
ncbi:hypothetical protein YPPY36_0559, partial [Yersinia pestis PY-36]